MIKEKKLYCIPIDIKCYKNIYESLNHFFEREIFYGVNKVFSDKCGKKYTANKNISIKI